MCAGNTIKKCRIITFNGSPGSGKTSVINKWRSLSSGWEVVSAGDRFRKMAACNNMSTIEYSSYAEKYPEVDRDIDNYIANFYKSESPEKKFLVDSRTAWSFIPEAFKVHLVIDIDVAAKRIYEQQRSTEKYNSLEDAVRDLKARSESENKRYFEKYNIDSNRYDNYNLVIDTEHAVQKEICELIADCLKLYEEGTAFPSAVWSKKSSEWRCE